jgi:hypothetical protein
MRNLRNPFKRKQFLVLLAAVGLLTVVSCTEAKKESKAVPQAPVQQEVPILSTADPAAKLSAAPATVPVGAPATGQAPELNPPHGQPYHRCDIAVGSPLSGVPAAKPAATINQSGTGPTVQNAGRVNNPPVLHPGAPTIANAGATPPKLNPAHGQPFHRCEIPVGSPLN